jgi:HEAT repeat protein
MLPLLADPDENVVVSAVEALGNMKSMHALPFLFEAYDRYEYCRAAVAEALGKIGDPAATGFLLEKLKESLKMVDTDPLTPFTLVEALGAVGTRESFTALLQDIDAVRGKLRAVLLHALARIADRVGEPVPVRPELLDDLLLALHDDDVAIRTSAARWLGLIPGAQTTDALILAMGSSAEFDSVVGDILVRRPESFATAARLLPALPVERRKAIIGLLGRLTVTFIQNVMQRKGPVAEENLFEETFAAIAVQWQEADEETRAAIVDALFRLDGDRAEEFLDTIMNDPDPWLRMHVIEMIAAIADRRAPDYIARFLSDDDEMVREVALGTLQAKGYLLDERTTGE